MMNINPTQNTPDDNETKLKLGASIRLSMVNICDTKKITITFYVTGMEPSLFDPLTYVNGPFLLFNAVLNDCIGSLI